MANAEVIASVPAQGGARVAVACDAKACGGICYDTATLDEIQRVATDRFLSIPRGGVEVGGLLFGRIRDDSVDILATQDFPIEYLSGPSFVLSVRDEINFAERLHKGAPTIDGAPLTVVGWWHSHTRSDVTLTAEDIRIHRKFFPGPRQLAVIVKPFKLDPAQIAVYRPDAAHGDTACSVFSSGKGTVSHRVTPAPVLVPTARVLSPRTRYAAVGAMAALVLILFAAGYWYSRKPAPIPPSPQDAVRLNLSASGNDLTIRWDGNSGLLATAKSAELIIVDGSNAKRIPLSVDSIRNATLAYARHGGKVEVRLRAWSRDNELVEAVAHYVGPVSTVAAPSESTAEVQRMKAELDRLNGELMRMRQAEPPPSQTAPLAPKPSPTALVRQAESPRESASFTPAQPTPAQPAFIPPPVVVTGGGATPPIQLPIQSPPPAETASPLTAAKLLTGRAIWTGVLPRGGVLIFDGRRPSAGAMTGRLPQRRSRIRVFPADLTASGIVVYTDGSKQAVEPPGPANGWNQTTYRADGKRFREVTVVEAPGQANNWQKLMVRSEQRPVSMLVVEWEEIP